MQKLPSTILACPTIADCRTHRALNIVHIWPVFNLTQRKMIYIWRERKLYNIHTKTMPCCMVLFICVFTFVLSFVKKIYVISFSIVKDSLSNVLYDVL